MRNKLGMLTSIACLLAGITFASAQQPAEHEKHHPDAQANSETSAPKGMMMEKCEMMKKEMDTMHAAMSDEQSKLDGLVKAANEATGSAKVDALAAAVTEMAAASRMMHAMHEEMMGKMMQHMSEHMTMMQGKSGSEKSGMMMCPMMSEHGSAGQHGATETPDADEHSAHHPN